ncbi:MAG: isoprenylcysteine carboxylmethyltransferase family protein [Phycisphaeraceae bacterium]|nr:isoprenylcysteine carboxylmethyltransferase family protein [Phycisphaeraceae bacterium]
MTTPSNASTVSCALHRESACPMHRLFSIRDRDSHSAIDKPFSVAGIALFAYGTLAYAAFLGAILYAIGFVGNWFVPKSIDSGAGASFIEAMLVNGGILVLFVVQHTIMARKWFKAWWTRIIPPSIERSTFVLAASAILGLLFWQWRPLPQVIWHVDHAALAMGLQALSLVGWATVLIASFMVSHFDLFGLRQVWFRLTGRPYRPVGFRLVGLYRIVRHPLMVGFLIAFWATPVMTAGHLMFALLTTGYIFFGVWIEERGLMAEHPEDYGAYRRRVRGFIPLPVARSERTT